MHDPFPASLLVSGWALHILILAIFLGNIPSEVTLGMFKSRLLCCGEDCFVFCPKAESLTIYSVFSAMSCEQCNKKWTEVQVVS